MKIKFHQRSIYLKIFSEHKYWRSWKIISIKESITNIHQIITCSNSEVWCMLIEAKICSQILISSEKDNSFHWIYICIQRYNVFLMPAYKAQILFSSETNNSFHWTVLYLYIYLYTYRYQSIWISECICGNLCACVAHTNINPFSWNDPK